jgi:hypothetical protein
MGSCVIGEKTGNMTESFEIKSNSLENDRRRSYWFAFEYLIIVIEDDR